MLVVWCAQRNLPLKNKGVTGAPAVGGGYAFGVTHLLRVRSAAPSVPGGGTEGGGACSGYLVTRVCCALTTRHWPPCLIQTCVVRTEPSALSFRHVPIAVSP